jgi:chemotaxis protein methyltransferase CheR
VIYFDSIAKKKVLSKFYDSLNPGGYLIIGFFDTMGYLIDNNQFKLVDEQAKIFQRA